MTQRKLILEYLKEHDSIIPARMSGKIYKGTMFGSEISRVCRTLRAEGKIQSKRYGKFEKFYITRRNEPFSQHMRFEGNKAVPCQCQLGVNHSSNL